jgi:hypothetical protein
MKNNVDRLLLVVLLVQIIACQPPSPGQKLPKEPLGQKLSSTSSPSQPNIHIDSSVPPVGTPHEELCHNFSTRSVPKTEIPRVFLDQNAAYDSFLATLDRSPEEALLQWIKSTATFSKIAADTQFEITAIPNDGLKNEGIYKVTRTDTAEHFIIKITTNKKEPKQLWKLKTTVIMHPECLVQLGRATLEQIRTLPKIPKMIEFGYLHTNKGDQFILLLEAAHGKAVSTFVGDINERLQVYFDVGKSLGAIHFLFRDVIHSQAFPNLKTWAHNDFHYNNVFYDSKTREVSLIDLESLDGDQGAPQIRRDILQITGTDFPNEPIGGGITQLDRILIRIIEGNRPIKVVPDGSLEPDLKLSNNERKFITLMHQRPAAFVESENYRLTEESAQILSAFVKGYLVSTPEQYKADVISYFQSLSREFIVKTVNKALPNTKHQEVLTRYLSEAAPPSVKNALEGHFDSPVQ